MATVLAYLRDVAVILSAIAGLIFGIYKYLKSREGQANLQIELSLDVHKIARRNLVSIGIIIRNLGKSAAYVGPSKINEAVCSICKIPLHVDRSQIAWAQVKEELLAPQIKYLDEWSTYYPNEPFIYEPNSIDSYTVVVSTSYHGPIWARAEIVDNNDYRWVVDRLFVLP